MSVMETNNNKQNKPLIRSLKDPWNDLNNDGLLKGYKGFKNI